MSTKITIIIILCILIICHFSDRNKCKYTSEHINILKHNYKYNPYIVYCYDDNYETSLSNDYIYMKHKNSNIISNKKELWQTLSSFYGTKLASQITPLTYVFPEDYERYSKECKNQKMILKINRHRQEGLFITKHIQSLSFISSEGFIIAQKFINDVLTYNGHKLTFRLYIIIECINNIFNAYYFNDGLVYYSKNKEGDIASFYEAKQLYDNYPITINEYENITNIDIKHNMIDKLKYLINAIRHNFCSCNDNNKYYELFGVDFHITSNLKTYILEVNSGPGMKHYCSRDEKMRSSLMKAYFDLMHNKKNNTLTII